jgi:hypothetical protein
MVEITTILLIVSAFGKGDRQAEGCKIKEILYSNTNTTHMVP